MRLFQRLGRNHFPLRRLNGTKIPKYTHDGNRRPAVNLTPTQSSTSTPPRQLLLLLWKSTTHRRRVAQRSPSTPGPAGAMPQSTMTMTKTKNKVFVAAAETCSLLLLFLASPVVVSSHSYQLYPYSRQISHTVSGLFDESLYPG